MGLIDSLKGAFGQGHDQEVNEIISDVAEEIEEEEIGSDEDVSSQDVVDEEPMEWDTAYQFAVEMIEPHGFTGGKDFATKVMFMEVKRSPLFRDRIASGIDTINAITSASDRLEDVKGNDSEDDLGELADEIENANRVIKSLESMEGKEDQMYQEIMGVAHKVANAWAENTTARGEIDSTVEEVNEDL